MLGFVSPIELVIVVVGSCFAFGLPIAIIVLLRRLIAIEEKKVNRPRPKI